ncbi:MAG: SLOG family protein [Anaerotignum propionicum]|uniref:SLOG family protein n=1 Tax=Anaerotignum propionicum TaxID=28446 RepID=UPI002B201595|nr:SLOG family protein [Anaerotignum propionicum]MEA5057272.1 SLOG family protein [Anaerotignum propionicum]
MQKQGKSLCFSGHRSERLPQSNEEMEKLKLHLWEKVDKAIENGIDTFYFGACYGFDLLCANVVLQRKRVIKLADPKTIKLIAVVPFEEQAKNWKESDREIYYDTLAQCDEVITLSTRYTQGCYHERNRYMVDHSNKLICYHDGSSGGTAYTVKYAEQKQLQIINLYEA